MLCKSLHHFEPGKSRIITINQSASCDDANTGYWQTDQHTEEPQVCSVVFMKPSPINMESMADEEHHGVVGADDQDEKN